MNKLEYYDWIILKLYILLLFINVIGMVYGLLRLFFGDSFYIGVLFISMLWVSYNIIILGVVVVVVVEVK